MEWLLFALILGALVYSLTKPRPTQRPWWLTTDQDRPKREEKEPMCDLCGWPLFEPGPLCLECESRAGTPEYAKGR